MTACIQIADRGRSPAYIEVADKLPRKPGKCGICGEDLVGFCAGEVDDTTHDTIGASIMEWFRFGCPEHDVHVFEWLGDNEGLCALRHESDPAWSWAPPPWRPALAKAGWSLPDPSRFNFHYPLLLVGELAGSVWITDRKSLIAFPEGTKLADVEEVVGPRVIARDEETSARETVEERARHRLSAEQIEPHVRLDGYEPAPAPRPPSALGWPDRWDAGSVALGEVVAPRKILDMIADFYPGVRWYTRGKLEAVRGVDRSGLVVASVMPADIAGVEARIAMEEEAETERSKPCPKCSHIHTGAPLGYICIGCACEWRPAAVVRAQAAEEVES